MMESKQFLRNLGYLANVYGWTPSEIVEIKAHLEESNGEMVRYWNNLAIACRAGYAQTAANRFLRLEQWCDQQGWTNPYLNDLKPKTMGEG